MDEKNGNKRLFAWVSLKTHNKAKASASLLNTTLQSWVAEAVVEKLRREKMM